MRKRVLPAALAVLALLSFSAGAALTGDPETAAPEGSPLPAEAVTGPAAAPPAVVTLLDVDGLKVSQSTSRVAVDGLQVAPEGYCINQENYYKLRDLAYLLSGKKSAFDVIWDDQLSCISMLSGKDYTVAGGEMLPSGSASIYKFVPSYSAVRLNGEPVQMTGYNINNNNYYRIRDVAPLVGFGIDWDKDTYTVVIDSKTEETPQPSVPDVTPPAAQMPPTTPETPQEPDLPGSDIRIPVVTPEDQLPTDILFGPSDKEDPEAPGEPEEPVYPWIGPCIDGELTILLDPGHGGSDAGSSNPVTGQAENRTNLTVAKYLKEMLEEEGVRVIMTRSSTSTNLRGTDRKARVREICEEGELDLVLSIHHNGSTKHTARGSELFVQPAGLSPHAGQDGKVDSSVTSQALGKRLLNSYLSMGLGLTSRGVKETNSYYMVYTSGQYGIPAVLSEFCFIDNADDVKLIDSDDDLKAEAKAIFDALMGLYETTPY